MEEFEQSSRIGIGYGGVRAKFRSLQSGMKEFEPSSKAWKRKLRSSSQVPMLGIGNGGVRVKFEVWNRERRSSSQIPKLRNGNGGVRVKFEA